MSRLMILAFSTGLIAVGLPAWASAPAGRHAPTRSPYTAPTGVYAAAGVGTAFPYATGFESAEGFSSGALNGQAGWASFTATAAQPVVSTALPQAGAQHMQLSKVTSAGSSAFVGGFSPLLTGVPENTASRTTVWFRADNVTPGPITGGAEYILAAQEGQSPGDELSWQINFAFDGTILVTDNIDADPDLEVVSVGSWVAGRYYRVDIDLDTAANQVRYYLDGALEHTSIGGVFAGNEVRQVVLLSDNFFVAGETGKYDSLSIDVIPEPASLAVLASPILLALRRRRD